MINFKSIYWKNLLSTGNAGTTVVLDAAPTTLIIGKNGHGKSTMLDALSVALYGKPFRSITKKQLINSINGKQCLTTVIFETDGKTYKVIRGIKPDVFEIWVDGEMLTQEAATKDYQKILEKQILKMNHKTFTQVIILGSTSFTPFMKLSAGHRREVIEDILDIKIFSIMGAVLKEKVSETKNALYELDNKIMLLKGKLISQKNLVEVMKKNKNEIEQEYKDKITINSRRIRALKADKDILKEQIANKYIDLSKLGDPVNAINAFDLDINSGERTLASLEREQIFFKDHSTCPQCEQGISEEHKAHKQSNIEEEIFNLSVYIADAQRARSEAMINLNAAKKINDEIRQMQIDIGGIDSEIKTIENQSDDYQLTMNDLSMDTGDLDEEKKKIKTMAAQIAVMLEEKIDLTEKRNLQEVANTLLKDSGIKTKIIREYLPLMNKLINKYLQSQDSFIQFEIDEQFEETIKSRHRDDFSYTSFSEGERQRIDLSILFTWRQIAKLKNSANTNLLIMDEIMDGSLDADGNDSAQTLIDMLAADGTHVFVVTHSVEKHVDKFDRILKFEKKNDYSVMSEVI